jgi:hypothetical protein
MLFSYIIINSIYLRSHAPEYVKGDHTQSCTSANEGRTVGEPPIDGEVPDWFRLSSGKSTATALLVDSQTSE